MNDIEITISRLIQEKLGKDAAQINSGSTFRNDLEVDSLDFFELVTEIEKTYDITIPEDVFDRLKTVGALSGYVAKQVDPALVKAPEMQLEEQEQR
jgi:acyl carrier protein